MSQANVVMLGVDMADADLGKITVTASREASKSGAGFYWCVHGYDDDPRELWEIPEVLNLIDRADSFGFMSSLDCRVDIAQFGEERLLGAFDFWLMRTRQMRKVFRVTKEMIDDWRKALELSNARADDTIARAAEWEHGDCVAKIIER